MKFLSRVSDKLEKLEVFLLAFVFIVMLVLAFLQVIMRNVFNAGIPWADSLVRLLVLWVGFLGAIVATKVDQHLTLEVLTKYLPDRLKPVCSISTKIFAIAVCYYLFTASMTFINNEKGTGEMFIGLIPDWWTLTIIPATFVMIALHFFINILLQIWPVEGNPS